MLGRERLVVVEGCLSLPWRQQGLPRGVCSAGLLSVSSFRCDKHHDDQIDDQEEEPAQGSAEGDYRALLVEGIGELRGHSAFHLTVHGLVVHVVESLVDVDIRKRPHRAGDDSIEHRGDGEVE